jgi:hypothetical protein
VEVQGSADARHAMRRACQLAARALRLAGSLAAPGVTTDALDAAVHDCVVGAGGYPSPLGYLGFPKSTCTSVNEVVCHGEPPGCSERQQAHPPVPAARMSVCAHPSLAPQRRVACPCTDRCGACGGVRVAVGRQASRTAGRWRPATSSTWT